ncbi:hypothetical protein HDZ31DRAFT_65420 [Schizophyllum fasciatum]
MRLAAFSSLVLAASAVAQQAQHSLTDAFSGTQLFDAFVWETFNDPTHGRVNYVDISIAIKTNLSYASGPTSRTSYQPMLAVETARNGPWPSGGEIYIIEGVNQNTANLASLHTTPNCSMPPVRQKTGATVSTDRDTNVNYNQGCGTSFTKANSYGPGFNAQGGGRYAPDKERDFRLVLAAQRSSHSCRDSVVIAIYQKAES